MRLPPILLALPVVATIGCGSPSSADLAAHERDVSTLAAVKGGGGVNGDPDYCDGAVACDDGEGDCDSDDQCKGNRVCTSNLGAQFGLDWHDDVCLPDHCSNGVLDAGKGETAIDWGGVCGTQCDPVNGRVDGHCEAGCPCPAGEGDCDIDADCAAGLVCGFRNGSKFGLAWNVDVCVPDHCTNGVQDADETAVDFGGADCGTTCGGVNGLPDGYCYPGCECASGEGDCDDADECQAGLDCAKDNGARHGFSWGLDTCEVPHCFNGVQDADETAIDFGGADCGSECVGKNGDPGGFCLPGCECDVGEGDCDADTDCASGLVCGFRNGTQFGFEWVTDMCIPAHCENGVLDAADGETAIDFGGDCGSVCGGQNGDFDGYCNPGCPCAAGEGQCATDDDCASGLVCALNRGDLLGMGASVAAYDVCWAVTRDGTGPIGDPVPANLALDAGAVAFAEDVKANSGYSIAQLNDGVYGDNNAWKGKNKDSFAGIALAGGSTIDRIAFGRSNDPTNDPCTDGCTDAWEGTYTLQYTRVASPDATTPDSSWTTIDVLTYASDDDDPTPTFEYWARHQYRFAPISGVTGVRIVTESGPQTIVIDEIEVFAAP